VDLVVFEEGALVCGDFKFVIEFIEGDNWVISRQPTDRFRSEQLSVSGFTFSMGTSGQRSSPGFIEDLSSSTQWHVPEDQRAAGEHKQVAVFTSGRAWNATA